MLSLEEAQSRAQDLVTAARRAGADAADAIYACNASTNVSVRLGALEDVERSEGEEIGLRVIAQWSGDGSIAELENTPKAKLNVLHCYRSMNYISRHMEEKYGIPWVEYNFFGPTMIEKSQPASVAE